MSEQTGLAVQDYGADAFEVLLASDTFADAAAFINRSQFTEVAGGAYVAQPTIVTWSRVGDESTLQASNVAWPQDPSGPQDIRTAVLVNATAVGLFDVITVVDLTADGTTPVDNQAVPININFALSPTVSVRKS